MTRTKAQMLAMLAWIAEQVKTLEEAAPVMDEKREEAPHV